MRRWPVVLLALAITAITTRASADEGWEPKPRWYGYQTIEVLLVAEGVIGAGAGLVAAHQPQVGGPLIAGGVVAHLIGPPLVHLAHHHNAGASWFLNTGFPFIVGAFAYPIAFFTCHDADCPAGAPPRAFAVATLATGSAVVAANVLDIATMSTLPRRGDRDRASFGVLPLVGPHRTGIAVGGVF